MKDELVRVGDVLEHVRGGLYIEIFFLIVFVIITGELAVLIVCSIALAYHVAGYWDLKHRLRKLSRE